MEGSLGPDDSLSLVPDGLDGPVDDVESLPFTAVNCEGLWSEPFSWLLITGAVATAVMVHSGVIEKEAGLSHSLNQHTFPTQEADDVSRTK